MEQVLTESVTLILERHLERASPPDLALWSLRGLSAIDGRLDAVRTGTELRLMLDNQVLATVPLAPLTAGRDARATAAAVATALGTLYDAAWRQSVPLRRAGKERVVASGFEEVFNHLDPYSRYVTPTEARAARERRVGQSGLGLRVAVQGQHLVVSNVTPNGPAAQAGIRLGERLQAVDGRPLSGREPNLAASMLEGPEGSAVVLTLSRGTRRRDVTLVRELVVPETVTAERRDDILWIRLSGFSVLTERRMTSVLVDEFAERAPKGVVLDLRGNRGGLLTQAVAAADIFLSDGDVARTVGRHPDAVRSYTAGGRDLAEGRPLVILVDGRTASAAEIVAMALAERRRAVVVGSTTTGKGLIQLVVPLPNEAEILVTWSQVVAPSGWPIQGLGVLPALCTSLGPDALAAGLARLMSRDPPMRAALARQRATRPPVQPAEVVALRGTCPPAEGRAADLSAARTLIDTPAAYAAALAAETR